MSRSLQFDLSAIFEAIRTNRYVQVGLVAVGVGAAAALWLWRPYVRLGLSASKSFALEFLFGSREQQLLEHVKKNAVKGDPESVLETIDKYCWDNHWMMHIGDEKGKILDAEVKKAQPKVAVEFGGYVGYSAIRIGRLLPAGSVFYTVEISEAWAKIATEMIAMAGLSERCKIIVGETQSVIPTLLAKIGAKQIDFLFIDHWKQLYLRDLKLSEQHGLLKKGSVIVADNVIFPGAPEYLAYIRNNSHYTCSHHASHVEYSDVVDGVEVSVVNEDFH